jgi:hypothetical protein
MKVYKTKCYTCSKEWSIYSDHKLNATLVCSDIYNANSKNGQKCISK